MISNKKRYVAYRMDAVIEMCCQQTGGSFNENKLCSDGPHCPMMFP